MYFIGFELNNSVLFFTLSKHKYCLRSIIERNEQMLIAPDQLESPNLPQYTFKLIRDENICPQMNCRSLNICLYFIQQKKTFEQIGLKMKFQPQFQLEGFQIIGSFLLNFNICILQKQIISLTNQIMNRFTLKFKDDKVEQLFQRSRAEIKQRALEKYSPLVCLVTLLILIYSLILESISISIFSSIFLILQVVAYYFILRKGFATRLQPIAMSIILSMSIILQIVPIIDDNMPHYDVDWIQDISLLLSINYVLSTDISWNFLFFTINLGLRLYIRYTESECFNILSVAFIICSLISFYNEYLRILRLRLEFELEEENQCSHNIFESFDENNIIILTFDHETTKFSLKFQNNCSIKHFQEFSSEFLKKMRVGSSNLGRIIYEQVKEKKYQVQKLKCKYEKQYYNVTFQVSNCTQLQIFIIITKQQLQKSQLVKSIFYKSLLMKVKKLDPKLFHKEVLKNMIYDLMSNMNKKISFKEIRPQEMLYFMKQRFKQVKFTFHVQSSIHTNLLMIDGLILLIKQMFQVRECTVSISPQNLVRVIFQGSKLERKQSKCRNQLFQTILLKIGTGKFAIERSTFFVELIDFKDYDPFK